MSQKYAKVLNNISEICNVFVLFKQSVRAIKDFIYKEIGNHFKNDRKETLFSNELKR